MSLIRIEIISGEAVVSAVAEGREGRLEFRFENISEGYLRASGVSAPLRGGAASFDLNLLPDGTLSPVLTLKDRVIPLPKIEKSGHIIRLISPSAESYHSLFKREAELRERLARLEERVEQLNTKVFGEPLFEFPIPSKIKERTKQ